MDCAVACTGVAATEFVTPTSATVAAATAKRTHMYLTVAFIVVQSKRDLQAKRGAQSGFGRCSNLATTKVDRNFVELAAIAR